MSWSVHMSGVKEKVRSACEDQFEKQAANYAGKEEEQDIIMAKQRTLSMLDDLDVRVDQFATHGYGVKVSASGSRSSYHTTISIEVSRIILVV